jgi:TolB protein
MRGKGRRILLAAVVAMGVTTACPSTPPTAKGGETGSPRSSPGVSPSPLPTGPVFPVGRNTGGGTGTFAFGCHIDERNSSGDICTVRFDGSHLRRLTSGPANEFDPSWSPDGRFIAFRSAPKAGAENIGRSDIWKVRADGTGAVNLTKNPDWANWSPAWSPDGREISFFSTREAGPGLYVMRPDGSGLKRIVDGDAEYPAWSPDSARIAFMSLGFPPGGSSDDYDVYVVTADGSGLKRLTQAPGETGFPAWSPDGARIAYVHDRKPGAFLYDIHLMNADGSAQHTITPGAGDVSYDYPDWSPDGSSILFSAYHQEGVEEGGIFLMHADGSSVTRLLDDGTTPVWQPEPDSGG